jgi:hypothetical protein
LYPAKTYVFRNSYGRMDSFTFTGKKTNIVQPSSETFKKQVFNNTYFIDGAEVSNKEIQDSFEQDSGYITNDMLLFAREFVNCMEAWSLELFNNQYYLVPIKIDDNDVAYQIERASLTDKSFKFKAHYNFAGLR